MSGTPLPTAWTAATHAYPHGPPQSARSSILANGHRHGSVTRLITPWDIGEVTHPFLLLNYAEVAQRARPLFTAYPPSGAMTLAPVLEGELSFEDERGRRGEVGAGALAWLKAGSVVWHEGGPEARGPLRAFQLWIARLTAPHGPVASETVPAHDIEEDGPVRVLLGQFGGARGRLRHAPPDINCFHVRLRDGQHFRYTAPAAHDVTVLTVDRGGLHLPGGERVLWEQVALFGSHSAAVEVRADGDTSFLLASAKRVD